MVIQMDFDGIQELYVRILRFAYPELYSRDDVARSIELADFPETWPARYVKKNNKYVVQINKKHIDEITKSEAILHIAHELAHIKLELTLGRIDTASGLVLDVLDEALAELVLLAKLPRIVEIIYEGEFADFVKAVAENFGVENPAYNVFGLEERFRGILNEYKDLIGKLIDPSHMKSVSESPLAMVALILIFAKKYGDIHLKKSRVKL